MTQCMSVRCEQLVTYFCIFFKCIFEDNVQRHLSLVLDIGLASLFVVL